MKLTYVRLPYFVWPSGCYAMPDVARLTPGVGVAAAWERL